MHGVPVVLLAWAFLSQGQEMRDNPEYRAWSSFKVGATARYEEILDNEGARTEMEITFRLLEINPNKAVVEKGLVKINEGARAEMPRETLEILARIPVEKEPGRADAPKVKHGTEEIEVAGKKYMCHWVETTEVQGTSRTWSRTWTCHDVPGGLVKMETRAEGGATASRKLLIVEWKAE